MLKKNLFVILRRTLSVLALSAFLTPVVVADDAAVAASIQYYDNRSTGGTRTAEVLLAIPQSYLSERVDLVESQNQWDYHRVPLRIEITTTTGAEIIKAHSLRYTYQDENLSFMNRSVSWSVTEEEQTLIGRNPTIAVSIAESPVASIGYFDNMRNDDQRTAQIALAIPESYLSERVDLVPSENQWDRHAIPMRIEIETTDGTPIVKAHNLNYTYEDGNLRFQNSHPSWTTTEEEENLIGPNPTIAVSIAESPVASIGYFDNMRNDDQRTAQIALAIPESYLSERVDLVPSENQWDRHAIPMRIEIETTDGTPIVKAHNLNYTYEDGNLRFQNSHPSWTTTEEEENLIGPNPTIAVSIAESPVASIGYFDNMRNDDQRTAQIALAIPESYLSERVDLVPSENQWDRHAIPMRIEIETTDGKTIVKAHNLNYTYEDGNLRIANPFVAWSVTTEEEELIGRHPSIEVEIIGE